MRNSYVYVDIAAARDPRASAYLSISTVFGHVLRDLCHRNAIYGAYVY